MSGPAASSPCRGRKSIVRFPLIVLFLTSCIAGCRPSAVTPAFPRAVEEPPAASSSKHVDLAQALLGISRAAGSDLLGAETGEAAYFAAVDRLVAGCRERLRGKKEGREIVRAINNYLFDEVGIQADPAETGIECLFPDSVIETKRGSCLAVSALYLLIGQKVDLPFRGVLVPGHFFVRYDDGRVRVNVETLSKGAPRSDRWYALRYNVPRGNACYLRSLSSSEVLAPYLFNLGNACRSRGHPDQAADFYRRALEILPGLAEAHGNLGLVYLEKGEDEKAISAFWAALEANPLFVGGYLDLGAAHQKCGRLDEALQFYTQGLAIAPGHPGLRHAVGTVYHKQGHLKRAVAWYRKALVADRDFAPAHRNLAAALGALGCHELAERHLGKARAATTSAPERSPGAF